MYQLFRSKLEIILSIKFWKENTNSFQLFRSKLEIIISIKFSKNINLYQLFISNLEIIISIKFWKEKEIQRKRGRLRKHQIIKREKEKREKWRDFHMDEEKKIERFPIQREKKNTGREI